MKFLDGYQNQIMKLTTGKSRLTSELLRTRFYANFSCYDAKDFVSSETDLLEWLMHRHHLVICLIIIFIEVLNCDLELNHSNKKYVKAFGPDSALPIVKD